MTKRRRAEADTTAEPAPETVRTTRSSAKLNTNKQSAGSSRAVAKAAQDANASGAQGKDDDEASPSKKKVKGSAAKPKTGPSKSEAAKGASTRGHYNGDATTSTAADSQKPTISTPKIPAPTPASKAQPPQPTVQPQPYTQPRALALFAAYADSDDADVIGPEGFERLCKDADIEMDGAKPLVLAWLLDAKDMGKLTKDEWVAGFEDLQIGALSQLAVAVVEHEELLVMHKDPHKRSKTRAEPYNRSRYWEYAEPPEKRAKMFLKLYMHCFALAKPPQARNIDIETAIAFWSVLLIPQYAIMAEVIEYLNERGSLKGVNKDLWSMMLEFCQTVKPSLENYEADGAWPTVLDDFVAWKKSKVGDEGGTKGEGE